MATLGRLLDLALEEAGLCSCDPLCFEHLPSQHSLTLHSAACHICLLAPGTACERGNKYLDLSLLVEPIFLQGRAFFDHLLDWQPWYAGFTITSITVYALASQIWRGLRAEENCHSVIDTDEREELRQAIASNIAADRQLLDRLRAEIQPLVGETHRIQSRNTSSISLVAADGGNNQLQFDPFLIQLVRVVDSASNSYCLEVVTPSTNIDELSARQFGAAGASTRLGELMEYLGIRHLSELSQMMHANSEGRASATGWIQVYRELIEWAVLFHIVRTKDFGNDTLIVFDGLLRSVVFAKEHFARTMAGISEAIERHWQRNRRHVYLVGVAKHSKVLDRYRLAMALEGLLTVPYAAYVEVPRELEGRVGHRSQYTIGLNAERDHPGGNLRVAGQLFWAKFGSATRDPIWPVDIYEPQLPSSQVILGSLLYDAVQGFPVPFYPRCLQQAHDHAALVGFDLDILQDEIFAGIRSALGVQSSALDIFRLRDEDPAQARYT